MNVLARFAYNVRWRVRDSITSRRRERNYRIQYGYEIPKLSPRVLLVAAVAIALGALLGWSTTTKDPPAATSSPLVAPPSASADTRVREAFARLSSARQQGRHDLAAAKSPSAQAAAALGLRKANLRAAADLGDHTQIADALRGTAAAYGALAAAARERDAKAFAGASGAVDGTERLVERLLNEAQ